MKNFDVISINDISDCFDKCFDVVCFNGRFEGCALQSYYRLTSNHMPFFLFFLDRVAVEDFVRHYSPTHSKSFFFKVKRKLYPIGDYDCLFNILYSRRVRIV